MAPTETSLARPAVLSTPQATKHSKLSVTIAIGFAIFSMFFGAGNAIFPLLLGANAGEKNVFAILGLLITAILVPFAGLFSCLLFGSDTRAFFSRIGRLPGALLALLILLVIGPFGGIPRCIALSHAMAALLIPNISLPVFGLIACAVLFLCTLRKRRVVALLGYVLTPLLLGSLLLLICKGLINAPQAAANSDTAWAVFVVGLKEGYNTLDLLAAFFFSGVVLSAVRGGSAEGVKSKSPLPMTQMLIAGAIAALLLGGIYAGLSFVSAAHGGAFTNVETDQLFGILGLHILGPKLGMIAAISVILACMTTAIALTSLFADALKERVFRNKLGYLPCLMVTLVVTYFVSYLKVKGIVALIAPIVTVCYPALIVLAIVNIAYKVKNFQTVKWPFYGILAVSFFWTFT